MTPKENILKTLRFEEPEAIPHFEDLFDLSKEAFGLEYPLEEDLSKAVGEEKNRLIDRAVKIYTLTAQKYNWAAIYVWRPWCGSLTTEVITELKRAIGARTLIGGFISSATWSLESISDYMQFSIDLYERPEVLKEEASLRVQRAVELGRVFAAAGADIVSLPNDWAFNNRMFMSRPHFEEFVMPYLLSIVEELKKLGLIVVVHSDGYLMEILDLISACGAHMFQSIDPLAGMDIAKVKKLTYGKIALQGNVNTVLLQNGTEDEIRRSAVYCLRHGAPGGGYVFSTCNCIFEGASLHLYDVMLNTHRDFNMSEYRQKKL